MSIEEKFKDEIREAVVNDYNIEGVLLAYFLEKVNSKPRYDMNFSGGEYGGPVHDSSGGWVDYKELIA